MALYRTKKLIYDTNCNEMSVEDYDILNILGNSISSATYKVIHKETHEIFVWHTIDLEHMDTSKIVVLEQNIAKRASLKHPNILEFYLPLVQKESALLYIITEFCENGSLKNIIESCLASNMCLSEEFVCKILYQLAFAIKTLDKYSGKLVPKEIFFGKNFSAKFYNFTIDHDTKAKELKMSHLGLFLYECCTFKIYDKKNYEKELKIISMLYSKSLLALIPCMVKDSGDLKKNIDKILCHPTVLLKCTQWTEQKCFLRTDNTEKYLNSNIKDSNENIFITKLEKIRAKENALQIREGKLREKENELARREKKIYLMEKTLAEKLQKIELYSKRNLKTSESISVDDKNKCCKNLDSTYVSCGDSVIVPTSKKLNINEIIKPVQFTRHLSEKKIRFKGHSPLKDIDFNKQRQSKGLRANSLCTKSEWITCSEDNDRSSVEGSFKDKKCKQLFPKANDRENDPTFKNPNIQCQPIQWTEESKKQAYDLLRLMNEGKVNKCAKVKHTFL